jgi:HAD superfamily hydrolase (TIGR01549 family)
MPLAIFDLDDTLIDRTDSFRRWAARFVSLRSLAPAEVEWLVAADGAGFVPRPAFRAAVQERYGLDGSMEEFIRDYRAQIVELIELDPRVPVALDRLREAGWRVAVATNGSAAQQAAKLRRTGLDAHVDAVAISEEVGAAKPDRQIFEAAARRCGADLAGGWMIGDNPAADVAGGQRAGLGAIWIRRGRKWSPADPAPDAIADDVPAAVAVLLDAS